MKSKRVLAFSLFVSVFNFSLLGQKFEPLRQQIEHLTKDFRAEIGVAVLYKDCMLDLNDSIHYPLMSVIKFHVSIAALQKMDKENISPDSVICMPQSSLIPNTYSPLRDKYPNQDIYLPIREVFYYANALSDNNACDWLTGFVGGINKVDSLFRTLNYSGFQFRRTYSEMQQDILLCYENWCTPSTMLRQLDELLWQNKLKLQHLNILKEAMRVSPTGMDKLRAGLGEDITLYHKTGHAPKLPSGVQMADNDAGIFLLDKGTHCCIAVFIKDSHQTQEENAKLIASIASKIKSFLLSQ